jgi:cation:H+ antiporter
MIALLGLFFGVGLLVAAGAALVTGASGVARRHGISSALIGLTIVALGTSAPELVVNVTGAIKNETAIAFGNVVGSNLANLGLVLALSAIIHPVEIHGRFVLREVPLLLAGTAIIVVMSMDSVFGDLASQLGRADGVVGLLLFSAFLYISALDVFRPRTDGTFLAEMEANPIVSMSPQFPYHWLLIVLGTVGLYWGGQLTIDNGVLLASEWGLSTTIVGLFVIAIGTSLPELVTSVIAALRNESDLALGNVVGSNIFNSLFILPLSAVIRPVDIPDGGLLDLATSLFLVVVIVPIFLLGRARLSRSSGIAMLTVYLIYSGFRATS